MKTVPEVILLVCVCSGAGDQRRSLLQRQIRQICGQRRDGVSLTLLFHLLSEHVMNM